MRRMAVTTEEAWAVVGELAASFAAMESNVKLLLERLIGTTDPFVLPLLIDGLTLYQTTERCRKAAEVKFVNEPERLAQTNDLLKRVDAMRRIRNLFIHGLWVIDPTVLPRILVHGFKLRRDGGLWLYLDEYRTSVAKLRNQLATVNSLLADLYTARASIKRPRDGPIQRKSPGD